MTEYEPISIGSPIYNPRGDLLIPVETTRWRAFWCAWGYVTCCGKLWGNSLSVVKEAQPGVHGRITNSSCYNVCGVCLTPWST